MIIIIFLILGFSCKRLVKMYMQHTGDNNATFLASVLRVMLSIAALIMIMQVNGINVGSLVAGLGLASVIVGFALQETFKDIIMGFTILSNGFYKVGDAVVYNGQEGIVTEFTMRTTKIRRLTDGASIVVCNRKVDEITRMSFLNDILVRLRYDEDHQYVRDTFERIAAKVRAMDGVENCIFKGTQTFGDSGIVYMLRFFCHPSRKLDMIRSVNGLIQDMLNEAGIEIPFNQLDVHMGEPAEAAAEKPAQA